MKLKDIMQELKRHNFDMETNIEKIEKKDGKLLLISRLGKVNERIKKESEPST